MFDQFNCDSRMNFNSINFNPINFNSGQIYEMLLEYCDRLKQNVRPHMDVFDFIYSLHRIDDTRSPDSRYSGGSPRSIKDKSASPSLL